MKFGTIIADPPWNYSKGGAGGSGFAGQQYEVLTTKKLAELPVAAVAADQAVLLLWTTAPFLVSGEAAELCEAWGFKPVTLTYWYKQTKAGNPHYGVGYWFRGSIEPVVVGKRGSAYRTNERGVFEAPVFGHSRKPDYLHELAERHFPAPRLEIFARRNYPGWTCTGNELDGLDIRDSLEKLVERDV